MGENNGIAGGGKAKQPRSIHVTLAVNSLSNVFRYFVFLAVALFLTPFVVRTLGNVAYGTWVVVLSLVGYANTLELGIQRAIVKLVAEKRVARDFETMNRLIATALVFFSLAGAVVILVFVLLGPEVLRLLAKDASVEGLGRIFFLLIGCDILFIFLNYVISSILYGWQLYHRMNTIEIVVLVIKTALIFLLLQRTHLFGLAAITALGDGVVLGLAIVLCRKTAPQVHLHLHGVSMESFRELLGFGGQLFVSSTMARLSNETQPVIISQAMSTAYTAFFAIPKRLVRYTREIHWSMARGFMPMFSEMERNSGTEAVRRMYFRYSRYLVLAMSPILVGILVYGSAFLGIWIGPEYQREGSIVLLLLTVTYAVELTQPLLYSLFVGVGQVNVLMRISVGSSILTIVSSIVLVRLWGINGVALAILVSTVISFSLFAIVLCRLLEVSVVRFFREVHSRAFLCTGIFFGAAYACSHFLGKGTYWQIIVGAVVSLPIYAAAAYGIAITAEERSWVNRRIRARVRRGR